MRDLCATKGGELLHPPKEDKDSSSTQEQFLGSYDEESQNAKYALSTVFSMEPPLGRTLFRKAFRTGEDEDNYDSSDSDVPSRMTASEEKYAIAWRGGG